MCPWVAFRAHSTDGNLIHQYVKEIARGCSDAGRVLAWNAEVQLELRPERKVTQVPQGIRYM